MQFGRSRFVVVLTLISGIGLPVAPPAAAMVILGGGAAIVIDGNSYCTLTTIGRDQAGDVVGFTGSNCGEPGSTVAIMGKDNAVGAVVAVNGGLHYSVIKFDVPDLLPVPDYAGTVINGIGPDPQFDALVCKYGPANPGICGRIRYPDLPFMMMGGQFDAGDVGAPVTMDGLLVGLAYNSGHLGFSRYTAPRAATYVTKFSAILADVNANGGPGSGFVPTGS